MAMQLILDEIAIVAFIVAASCTSVIASCIVVTSFLIIFKYFFVDLKLNP
jgi:hypothetical protein